MNKFIKNIIAFSLKNKAFTFIWVGILAVLGFFSFKSDIDVLDTPFSGLECGIATPSLRTI